MKHSKTLSALILGGTLALTGSAAFAAENAEGVREHMKLTVETAQKALAAAKAGDKATCLSEIKQSKQHYKELTGDAAGKPMQDAMKTVNVARDACEKGDTAGAAESLTTAVAAIEKVNAIVQSK